MKTAIAFILRDVRSIPHPILDEIRAALPTDKNNPRDWHLKSIPVRWTQGDKKAAARRNTTAAATCSVLVVMKNDKFAAAAVRAFRHRGRTCYYWTGSRLIEERISPVKIFNPEPSADSNQIDEITHQIFNTVTTIPAQPVIEAEIWNERTRENRAQIDAAMTAQDATMLRLQFVAASLAAAEFAYLQTARPCERFAVELAAIRLDHLRATMTLDAFNRSHRARRSDLLWSRKVESQEDIAALDKDDITHPRHGFERVGAFGFEETLHRAKSSRRPAAE